jgi:hypothetical protein
MKQKHILTSVFSILLTSLGFAEASRIKFNDVEFFHRWSQANQHEFTPEGQEDLKSWRDMLTVNFYPEAKSGDDLASIANNLLGLYQQHGGMVLRTDSKPRTEEREAEHLIAVAIPQNGFIEIAFVRLAMTSPDLFSIVYSHRIYGSEAGDKASAWLQENGPKSERALMDLETTAVISIAKRANK